MKLEIYNFLVNRHSGIKVRYHAMHDDAQGMKRVLSHFYLLWLNFAYYCLFMKHLGIEDKSKVYEEKNLKTKNSETAAFRKANPGVTVSAFVEELSKHDVVSFDIFDTLIFRPFSQPTDLFFQIGKKLEYMDFCNMRIRCEYEARWIHADEIKARNKEGQKQVVDYEVTLDDIWNRMQAVTDLDTRRGQAIEEALEQELCYANPFMKAVYDELIRRGKRIVITSDMYLGKSVLESILEGCGYTGYERFFLSNVYHKSKSDGRLYDVVREYVGRDCDIIHVGDNLHSDIKMAKRAHFATLHYPNVNTDTLMFRPYDMSPIVGGAYRGIVNNRLYNGASLEGASMEYEYGFVYGGLFAMGYCAHIHEYVEAHDIDKVLFLSRDGDILKQVYERMYPADAIAGKTAYAYWSRKAATVLMFDLDRNDFYRRFLYHKVNQGYKLSEILHSMELDSIADEIEGFRIGDMPADLIREEGRAITLHLSDELCAKNVHVLREALDRLAMRIREAYRDRDAAAKQYYMSILRDARSAVAVDIGWAGSGAIALRRLCHEHWGINCDLRGMIAGTNTVYNAEPYQTETFLQSGIMDAYLYSMSHNRDLMKKHNPNLDYNIYWELLLSSPTQQFVGFKLNAAGEVEYDFGKYDANLAGIRDVQTGILDFVEDYMEHFGNPVTGDFPEMYKVSGRDAYAPMIVASSHHERYLKTIERRFALEMNVV